MNPALVLAGTQAILSIFDYLDRRAQANGEEITPEMVESVRELRKQYVAESNRLANDPSEPTE
ncbi:MAG: hypothetical protein CMJ75_18585 [Planctomycetaceae bacterium]|nr:hypothetical protein [Planctomycetaceae bacterium]